MRCELALQMSKQLHLQRTYFFPAGAGRIACNNKTYVKSNYAGFQYCTTNYTYLHSKTKLQLSLDIKLFLSQTLGSSQNEN